MAILRTLDRVFAALALSRKYALLFSLGDGELASRGLARDTLGQHYLRDLEAQSSIPATEHVRADRRHAHA